jgi:hypothetical protein
MAAAQAYAFYNEVAQHRIVWAIRDAEGYPAPKGHISGQRAMPFWSLKSRAEKIISSVQAYRDFQPDAISWEAFRNHWIPGMTKDELLVGVNWSGSKAKGYDLTPGDLLNNIEAAIRKLDAEKL